MGNPYAHSGPPDVHADPAQNELQKNQFQAQGDSIKAAGKRWNGQMPQGSGNAVPMIQLPGAAK